MDAVGKSVCVGSVSISSPGKPRGGSRPAPEKKTICLSKRQYFQYTSDPRTQGYILNCIKNTWYALGKGKREVK